MKDGDFAGLCLLQKNYGIVGVKLNGSSRSVFMINASTGKPEEVQSVPLNQNVIYFKAECDFSDKKDVARFYYSLDGKTWAAIGTDLKMAYTLPHFMGYRFGLFNYATKNAGGYADFDFFRINRFNYHEDKLIKSILLKQKKIMKLTLLLSFFFSCNLFCSGQSYTISSPDKNILVTCNAEKNYLQYIL
jgi:hypothetical protein